MQITPLAHALSSVVLGPEIPFRNLLMFPILSGPPPAGADRPLDYLTLDDAMAEGRVEVTEVSEAGSVPELRVINRADKPTLIVDGEELVGAKQNRVVNLTILVAARSTLTVPVSCVEAGRWRARTRAFASAPRAQYASGRASRMSQVTASMLHGGTRRSDQAQVWAEIAAKSARLKSVSPTGAMEAMFEAHAAVLEAAVAACRPVDRQVGALFVVAGRVVGFDLFDSERTLRKILPKLVRSAAVDALDADSLGARPPEKPFPVRQAAEHFVARVRDVQPHTAPAVGLGHDLRFSAEGLTGAALAAEGRIVHIAAFSVT